MRGCIRGTITLAIIFLLMFSAVTPTGAQYSDPQQIDTIRILNGSSSCEFQKGPVNPEFLAYLQDPPSFMLMEGSGVERVTGLIPSPYDLPGLNYDHMVMYGSDTVSYPVYYDLRTLGKLTGIRDQGSAGSCWAQATYASLESFLLPGELWDFSENNMKNLDGFDRDWDDGGNQYISTAYLARWSGPVNESDDPYSDTSGYSPPGLPVQKHVQDVIFIPGRSGYTDNDAIKSAVMTYGAVYTVMYWSPTYMNYTSNSYRYTSTSSPNHAVAIVGWDDDFDKNNFKTAPAGNGAFIIKNSWGEDWGENGYFYISYYDTRICRENAVFTAEPVTNYDRAYLYDPLGWVSTGGFGSNTAWFANVFTCEAEEMLSAVSFYTPVSGSSYEIYVYDNVVSGPVSSTLLGNKSGVIADAGYHTVKFNDEMALHTGNKFSVVVRLTTPGTNYPIPIEDKWYGYSSDASSNPGESYISSNGVSWTDMTSGSVSGTFDEANVCLKAFTSSIIDISPLSMNLDEGDSGVYMISLRSEPAGDVVISIGNDDKVALNRTSVTFTPAGWETPECIEVTAIDDDMFNDDPVSVITHSSSSGDLKFNGLSISNVTVNIVENDATGELVFSAAQYQFNENAGNAVITVNRLNGDEGIIKVNYATSGVTAVAGQDYTAANGILTFNNGETAKTFNIPLLNDAVYENNETVLLALSNATNGSILGPVNTSVLTILNDDPKPVMQFSSSAYTVNENSGSKTIAVTLTDRTDTVVSVRYATSNDTAMAGIDYIHVSGILSFVPGNTTQTFSVPIIDDATYDGDKRLSLTLSDLSSKAMFGGNSTANLTIIDNESRPSIGFTAPSYNVNESGGNLNITVIMTGTAASAVTVDYSTSNGTATVGDDFTQASGTLTFSPGNTTGSFTVEILDDDGCEGNETFYLSLSNASSNAVLDEPDSVIINVIDDEKSHVTIDLPKGWNLISIPVVLDEYNSSVENLFASIKDDIHIVWIYNLSDPDYSNKNGWAYYTPRTDIYYQGKLEKVNEKMGIWVYSENNTSLEVFGSIPPTTEIPLKQGWNLIGNPTFMERNVSDVYYNSHIVWEYDRYNTNYKSKNGWGYYTPRTDIYYQGNLTTLKPCYGYWVYIE
ncbi:hypothetical protein CUJ83_10640 [Methanocella sp. CWC-04]|uniref:Calx-beta domain-containing protein n=1 Tax=Methanooceanicella nereidis TaxID=2052831 RepID=A0AAP2RD92_9EURY|nr:Calx-beta domain-containing protein [Methanocella sp. CWC-04]MCD1295456.1 hypothetical protein [Methanocella sp. CWC-04]